MHSINGVGTTLYGKTDIDQNDGSYIATKWFIFLLFPIFPMGSYRVWRGDTKALFFGAETEYRMIKINMNWKQVIKTYLAVLCVIIILIILISIYY